MVQPISLLATRDAAGTRKLLATCGHLESLWMSDAHMFEAAVYVCVPVVVASPKAKCAMRRFIGADFRPLADREIEDVTEVATWSELMTEAIDAEISSSVLGDLCSITADFRDQYYGLIPFVLEDDGVVGRPRLLTTGLVDPAHIRWGSTHTRFGKQRWESPVVDLEALHADGSLSKWVADRLVPKIMVASQTKVIEAAADTSGRYLPSVPLLTLIPNEESHMWRILAVVLSPYASYWAHSKFQGAGMNADAIKVSAKQLALLPLPVPSKHWDEAAEYARCASEATDDEVRRQYLVSLGQAMNCAYQTSDDLLAWWTNRLGVSDVSA